MRELIIGVFVHVNDMINKVFNSDWKWRCVTTQTTHKHTPVQSYMIDSRPHME